MASLRKIMNLDDDPDDISSFHGGDPTPSLRESSQSFGRSSANYPPTGAGEPRRGALNTSLGSSTTLPPIQPAPAHGRRTVTPEDLDRHMHPLGHTTTSSSKSSPVRALAPGEAPSSVKLTPVTRRVSKALKGVAVHQCPVCQKVFTRNEHLKRHQLSHQKPSFSCPVPGCDREFFRKDLLERHQQRHDQEPEYHSRGSGSSRSPSVPDAKPWARNPHNGPGSEQGGPGATIRPRLLKQPLPATGAIRVGDPGKGEAPSRESEAYPRQATIMYNVCGGGSSALTPQFANTIQSMPGNPVNMFGLLEVQSAVDPRTNDLGGSDILSLDFSSGMSHPQNTHLPNQLVDPVTQSISQNFHDASHWQPVPGIVPPSPFTDLSSSLGTEFMITKLHSTSAIMDEVRSSTIDLGPPLSDFPADPRHFGLGVEYIDTPSNLQPMSSPQAPVTSPSAPNYHHPSVSRPQNSSDAPSYRYLNSLASLARQKEALSSVSTQILSANGFLELPTSLQKMLPRYIKLYWETFDLVFPIVHKKTAEYQTNRYNLLHCAMAAVATQYTASKRDRINGNQLHELVMQQMRFVNNRFDVSIMQTVVLGEFFSRFRGRKLALAPSATYASLYQQLIENLDVFSPSPLKSFDASQWKSWVTRESRRRVLAACFVLDTHSGIYYEQDLRHQILAMQILQMPPTRTTQSLWEALNAGVWATQARTILDFPHGTLSELDLGSMTVNDIENFPAFDKSLILAAEALTLQRRNVNPTIMDLSRQPGQDGSMDRVERLFPDCPVANTYLALECTPLQDLLAVTGDTYVFTFKVMQQCLFKQQQLRLKQWGCSKPWSRRAVMFASRALVSFLGLGGGGRGYSRRNKCISDYWGVYVCALICWAFGHSHDEDHRASDGAAYFDPSTITKWLQAMAENQSFDLGNIADISDGVIRLVRERLAEDCVGGKNRLFDDAVGVLRRLEEDADEKRF